MKIDPTNYLIRETGRFEQGALLVGIAALALSFLGYFSNPRQFFFSYLTAYTFWVSIGLGGLFLTMLHHLSGAVWSVVLRRIIEAIMITLPFIAVLFLPIAFGLHHLYHWSHSEVVATDSLLQKKSAYLNQGFFLARTVLYFLIWILLARTLHKISVEQDRNYDVEQIRKMRRVSAYGMILFGLSVTFASFDWLMSLDAHWYSTIFGLYFFAGCMVAIISFVILTAVFLRSKGVLLESITIEHYHDLGKLLFTFTVFWAYMAFSQYFLIWYANIPEETIWYMHRWEGLWKEVSLFLVLGHFVFPFFVLIVRGTKRRLKALGFMALWMLIMHWVDLYWIVLPSLDYHDVHFSWMDATAMIGIGGIFIWILTNRLKNHPIVPINDPSLQKSISFINN